MTISRSMKVATVFLAFLVCATPILAQQAPDQASEYFQGKLDGEREASGSGIWFLAGLGCGVFGLGAAYLSQPAPPAINLVGKSQPYAMGYTDGYRNSARNQNTTYAAIGWAVWLAILVGAYSG